MKTLLMALALTSIVAAHPDGAHDMFPDHMEKLRAKAPAKEFVIIAQPPFVVVGDEDEATVKVRSQRTVKWAVDKLKALYFKKDPANIIDVWLFKDAESYERNAKRLFGSKPTTPYGYYTGKHHALVMNISTGGGTLVHEIVHPFVEANFPNCPAWINEGLGSLYEQSDERDGRIWGLTNWRLAGLQKAIRDKRLPSFYELCKTTDAEFYAGSQGDNYAQARYLMYYLQEKGLLQKFWQEALANSGKDSSGYKALLGVLGETDMLAFKRRWEKWAMALRFP